LTHFARRAAALYGYATLHRTWTAAKSARCPTTTIVRGRPGELFVTPAPSWPHQWVVGGLFRHLANYLQGQSWGEGPISSSRHFVPRGYSRPARYFRRTHKVRRQRRPRVADIRRVALAVESFAITARADRQAKRPALSVREGVGEYWVVDPDARVVERCGRRTERPEIVTGTLRWHPEPSTAAFELDLPAFSTTCYRNR